MDEKKDIIAQAGMELSDDELDMVAGGFGNSGESGQSRFSFVIPDKPKPKQ